MSDSLGILLKKTQSGNSGISPSWSVGHDQPTRHETMQYKLILTYIQDTNYRCLTKFLPLCCHFMSYINQAKKSYERQLGNPSSNNIQQQWYQSIVVVARPTNPRHQACLGFNSCVNAYHGHIICKNRQYDIHITAQIYFLHISSQQKANIFSYVGCK